MTGSNRESETLKRHLIGLFIRYGIAPEPKLSVALRRRRRDEIEAFNKEPQTTGQANAEALRKVLRRGRRYEKILVKLQLQPGFYSGWRPTDEDRDNLIIAMATAHSEPGFEYVKPATARDDPDAKWYRDIYIRAEKIDKNSGLMPGDIDLTKDRAFPPCLLSEDEIDSEHALMNALLFNMGQLDGRDENGDVVDGPYSAKPGAGADLVAAAERFNAIIRTRCDQLDAHIEARGRRKRLKPVSDAKAAIEAAKKLASALRAGHFTRPGHNKPMFKNIESLKNDFSTRNAERKRLENLEHDRAVHAADERVAIIQIEQAATGRHVLPKNAASAYRLPVLIPISLPTHLVEHQALTKHISGFRKAAAMMRTESVVENGSNAVVFPLTPEHKGLLPLGHELLRKTLENEEKNR